VTESVEPATKAAVALWSEDIVTVQPPAPVQAPLQPLKSALVPGVAVSVTRVPDANAVEQVPDEHDRPAGELVTLPGPVTATESVCVAPKVALTEVLVVTDASVQVLPVPASGCVQGPFHPVKTELAPGFAMRVTWVPVA
jgi:hypothetical protein